MNRVEYLSLYEESLQHPNLFWSKQAERWVTWMTKWDKVLQGGFDTYDTAWFIGGHLNVSYNCLDRHLKEKASKTAIIWEGDEPCEVRHISYLQLYEEVNRFANVLKKQGIKKGDKVCIYLPMIPEAVVAMLACARIGAVHIVVFAGFSALALQTRMIDAQVDLVITTNEACRGGKTIPTKQYVDTALKKCSFVKKVIVVKRTDTIVPWVKHRDAWYHELLKDVDSECTPVPMEANEPLFILYTSGSTGKPKGVVHSTGGYLVYVAFSYHCIFGEQADSIYWCTADIGWITGHSYLVYGPLSHGATTVMYEGTPQYPTPARFWEIIDRHKVSIFYTAPTAIRALRHAGEAWVKSTNRQSLTLLGTVGEPINPDVWQWYYDVIGKGRCPIVDTWWQTETGGIMITPFPGATPSKPGSAAWPFFGIEPVVVKAQGEANTSPGKLMIKRPWPGFMQTIYGDRPRFLEYFKEVTGMYYTGDNAFCDSDGYYWITGRDDDVIKVSGHRLSAAELESAFVSHSCISEAAVVSMPDEIKGQGIYAFIVLQNGVQATEIMRKKLIEYIREVIGPIATPNVIQWAHDLPKTRSGKIMRRILRQIAAKDFEHLGDTSTLANPATIKDLIRGVSYGN